MYRLIKYITREIIRALPLMFVMFSYKPVYCQFYEFGQDPATIRWNQINTGNFKVIFPRDFNEQALKISYLLEQSYNENASQLRFNPGKIPVVIHNQTVISNGFVGIAPRRMEIFTYPDPTGYPGEWLKQLSVHEQRHVTQVDKLNQGFTRFLSILTGEQGQGFGAALLPFWLLEGDAVFAETSLTYTGRGRLPSFEKELKAILAANPKRFSHEKAFLGSYKDFIPDYYRYGYQLVNYARTAYGEDLWPDAVSFTGRNSWMISPLSYYLKKKTGLNRTGLHNESMKFIRQHWEETAKQRTIEDYEVLTNPGKVYSSYRYPHFLNDSSFVALKTGLDIIPVFISIQQDGTETRLFTPGVLNSGRISVFENRILWDEVRPDIRWINRNYGIIREYNFETNTVRSLTVNSRYSSPSYSPGGDVIVAIENTPQQETFMVLLSALDGEIISRIPAPGNVYLQSPEWIKGTSMIAAIANNEMGKRILLFDRETNSWETIFHAGFFDVQDLKSMDKYLFFQGSFNGTDDIYALNIKNRELSRITFSAYGAFHPDVSANGNELCFSIYTKDGYKPGKLNLHPSVLQPVNMESLTTGEQPFFNTQMSRNTDNFLISVPDNYTPEIKKYSKLSSLFRFHSWVPLYIDYDNPSPENVEVNPGFAITSQNTLSTAFTSLGYEYSDKEHLFHASFTYKGILPVIKVSFDYGGNPAIYRRDTIPAPVGTSKYMNFNALTYIPVNLSSGNMISGLQPIMKYTWSGNYFYYDSDQMFRKGIHYIEPRLYIYSYRRMAYRDLQPRWGIILDGRRLSAPFEEEQIGSLSSFRSVLYLPGVLKNQGVKLQFHRQNQNTEKYLLNNQVTFPRGYNELTAIKLSKYSADYISPLLYPDFRIGPLFYLKRIYASLFGDYCIGNDIYEIINNERVVSDKNIHSAGVELHFEYHLFRFLFPFTQGLRVSYVSENQKFVFENIFSINLYSF